MRNSSKSLKQFIKQLTPPLFINSFKKAKGKYRTWKGVFAHYRDVNVKGNGFDNNWYANEILRQTQEALAVAKGSSLIPFGLGNEHRLLSLLAAILISKNDKKVKILDFGGGAGIAYVHLLSSIINKSIIDYHIVENQKLTKMGSELFKDDKRIHFYTALPDDIGNLDIIYLSSVLQYIEDYAGLLKSLSEYKAKYILFTHLSSGDIPTYATAQVNMPGAPLRYWFINLQEIIDIMARYNYSLVFKAPFENNLNQDNFPENNRLRCTCALLFVLG